MMENRMKQNRALNLIPKARRQHIEKLVSLLSRVKGVKAIVLGGSYARGTAVSESDIDIGIYYSEDHPFKISAIKKIAHTFSKADKPPIVTQFYEWGAWVNGGAWISTEFGKIDLLYRNIEHVERVINDARQGLISWDFEQQPPYGFYSVIYLAETQNCIPFFDSEAVIQSLQNQVKNYPKKLKKTIIQKNLWEAEFSLLHAKKCAQKHDIYSTAGCAVRIIAYFTQVLFALNDTYFISDREAINTIEQFTLKPKAYKHKLETILAYLGHTQKALENSMEGLHELFLMIKKLCNEFYESKYPVN